MEIRTLYRLSIFAKVHRNDELSIEKYVYDFDGLNNFVFYVCRYPITTGTIICYYYSGIIIYSGKIRRE